MLIKIQEQKWHWIEWNNAIFCVPTITCFKNILTLQRQTPIKNEDKLKYSVWCLNRLTLSIDLTSIEHGYFGSEFRHAVPPLQCQFALLNAGITISCVKLYKSSAEGSICQTSCDCVRFKTHTATRHDTAQYAHSTQPIFKRLVETKEASQ